MCEEGERALWHEAARASTTWRRVHDPSDDEGGPPCPEACKWPCEAKDDEGDRAGDQAGEEAPVPPEDHGETHRSQLFASDLASVLRAHPGDDSSDVHERWCDYGPEFMRGRPYRPPAPQMPPKPTPLDVAGQPNLLAREARSQAGEYVLGERNAAGQCGQTLSKQVLASQDKWENP